MVIVFPFLGVGFANISPTFLISCEVQIRHLKTLKYSEQYIRDPLSGTEVRIWVCSEYDAVFKGALSGLRQFLAIESPVKTMKNAFYFTSKALLVLNIFKILS